jgi:hypothetical protein
VQQIDSAAGTIRGMREFLRRGDLERHHDQPEGHESKAPPT